MPRPASRHAHLWDTLLSLCASARHETALVCTTAGRYKLHTTGRSLARRQRLRPIWAPNSKHKPHKGGAKRSLRNDTTRARAHTHVIADDIDGVGVELGGRWPVRKLGLELEEHGAQSCTCHLGWGETLDDPDCPAAVRSGQWGSGTPSTRRSTAIATTTCLPRQLHSDVRASSRTQR